MLIILYSEKKINTKIWTKLTFKILVFVIENRAIKNAIDY